MDRIIRKFAFNTADVLHARCICSFTWNAIGVTQLHFPWPPVKQDYLLGRGIRASASHLKMKIICDLCENLQIHYLNLRFHLNLSLRFDARLG